jgi:hypothetical protein
MQCLLGNKEVNEEKEKERPKINMSRGNNTSGTGRHYVLVVRPCRSSSG